MDSTYPTTKIKEENDEAGASTSIKLEKPDLDDETNDDSVGFEEVHTWVGSSSADHMEIDNNEPSGSKPIKKEKVIKHDSDLGDQASCDILDRIKKEPDPEEWDELNPTIDIPDKVELEDLTAVGVKVEPGDELDTSIKKEEMDTTQLNEEVDIKPDELPNADVDSGRKRKYRKGLRVRHREAEGELFICFCCNYTTRSKENLVSHILSSDCNVNCDANKVIRQGTPNVCCCSHCNRVFSRRTNLNEHIIKMHAELVPTLSCKIYYCANCDYKTALKGNFDRHVLVHEDATSLLRSYGCTYCDVVCKSKQGLDYHIIKKHPEYMSEVTRKIHRCAECDYKTAQKSELNSHIRSKHPGVASEFYLIPCVHCNKTFVKKVELDNHIIRKHPNAVTSITSKIHKCPECDHITTRKYDLDRHIISKHPDAPSDFRFSLCARCDKTFKRKILLDHHIIRNHPDDIALVTSKIHKCERCDFITTKKCELEYHVVSDHPDAASESKLNTCVYCNKPFKKKESLDDHIVRKHPSGESLVERRVHKCSECSYQTTRKTNLDSHISAKHMFKPTSYRCGHCISVFRTERALEDHIVRKHPEFISLIKRKVHSCSHCTYKTVVITDFQRHARVHTDSVASLEYHKCTVCDKRFKSKKTLDDHVLKTHQK